MAITATTLSSAIGASDTTIQVASATGITAPNFTSGVNIVYLFCEQEAMLVLGITSTFVSVQRGILGTAAAAHGTSAPIISGTPSDYASFVPSIKAAQDLVPANFVGWSAPVAIASNVVVATGAYFHVTGTTVVKNITAPAGVVEGGEVTLVFDGSGNGLTWDATGNIAVAGTATTAASAVTFTFDSGSAKWHPSRLA